MQPEIYLLWHTYAADSGDEDHKLIGVYSSEARAQEALEQVRSQPGFRDHPDGFGIYESRLDSTGWQGGFSARPDPDDQGEGGKEQSGQAQ